MQREHIERVHDNGLWEYWEQTVTPVDLCGTGAVTLLTVTSTACGFRMRPERQAMKDAFEQIRSSRRPY